MRPTEKLKVDGRLGPKTMEAIKEVVKDEESEKRFKELYTKRLERLHEDTVQNWPKQKKFLNGWMKRSRTWNHHRLYPEMFGLKKEE